MTVKILVVDDEPDLETLLRQKFRRQIREREYEFFFAQDGEDALLKIQEAPDLDIILSDINMPRMDGLTLLQKVKENDILVKSVIISAYGDMGNIRTAMNRGAFDFLTKPIDFADLEATLSKTREAIRQIKQAQREHQQLEKLRQELQVASNIQSSILPPNSPHFQGRTEFELYARMVPAMEVGGDFYDYFLIDPDHLGFVVGDVSGKGVPAAIFMALSRTLLRATALTARDPQHCLQYVNTVLCREDYQGMFVTLLYGVLNTRSGEVTLATAGHEPPFLMRASGAMEMLALPRNLPLAVEEGCLFEPRPVMLRPGDAIFVYTDGVTEAEAGGMGFFRKERLGALLESAMRLPSRDMVTRVFDVVQEFTAGQSQSDDITCLALRYHGATGATSDG